MDTVMYYVSMIMPTVAATLSSVVIPLVIKFITTRRLNKKLEALDAKLQDSISQSNIADIRSDIKAMRNEIAVMRGKSPEGGKR